jgi:putative transposase
MPRKPLERSDCHPYHVTARANNREAYPVPLREFWEILGFECLVLSIVYGVQFQALVLMPNHLHLITTVPDHDFGLVMNVLMRSITQSANRLSGRSGRVFGSSCYRSLIKETRYYRHAIKYVYRNPVKAGLCERVEEYPYSTLRGLLGSSQLPFPIFHTRMGMELSLPSSETSDLLPWLNKPFPKEAELLIRKGLRKRIFLEMKNRETRKPYELFDHLI